MIHRNSTPTEALIGTYGNEIHLVETRLRSGTMVHCVVQIVKTIRKDPLLLLEIYSVIEILGYVLYPIIDIEPKIGKYRQTSISLLSIIG